MKRYLITEVVTAKPMTYMEACVQHDTIGTLTNITMPSEPGFVLCHTRPFKFEWVSKSAFIGVPFDNNEEMLKHYFNALEEISDFVKKYSKSATEEQRNIIYSINRHMKAIKSNFKKLID